MRLKDRLIRKATLKTWRVWESLGLHLIPNHFYWPIPDSRSLQSYDFDARFRNDGIEFNSDEMLSLVKEISRFRSEYSTIHRRTGYSSNGDGAILYGMIRMIRPKHVIEVGSGSSTAIIEAALSRTSIDEKNQSGKITCIEPFPSNSVLDIARQSPRIERLISRPVQQVDASVFEGLGDNDVLFIDSSHVLSTGSDVHYLFLRVIPRLAPGVWVHIHDIRYPQDYPRDWVLEGGKHWSEQYLLQAFLAFNSCFKVVLASNYLYCDYPRIMEEALVDLPSAPGGWPGSFWIRRVN